MTLALWPDTQQPLLANSPKTYDPHHFVSQFYAAKLQVRYSPFLSHLLSAQTAQQQRPYGQPHRRRIVSSATA